MKKFLKLIIVALIISNVFFIYQYINYRNSLKSHYAREFSSNHKKLVHTLGSFNESSEDYGLNIAAENMRAAGNFIANTDIYFTSKSFNHIYSSEKIAQDYFYSYEILMRKWANSLIANEETAPTKQELTELKQDVKTLYDLFYLTDKGPLYGEKDIYKLTVKDLESILYETLSNSNIYNKYIKNPI